MKKRQWVIIRGLGREAEHSAEFIDKLRVADPQSEVKCIDLPGAGEFYKLASPMSIDAIAEFIYLQLKNDKASERYIVSISLGSMVTAALLQSYPDVAQGAVFTNTSFSNLSSFYYRLQLDAFMHLYRAMTAVSGLERERAILDMVSNRSDRHMYAESWAEIARKRPVSPANFFKQLFAAATYSLSTHKPSIPMLVVVSAQDHMVSPECSKKFSEFWNLPLETHPTAGHELWLDDGDWLIEKMLAFFKLKAS